MLPLLSSAVMQCVLRILTPDTPGREAYRVELLLTVLAVAPCNGPNSVTQLIKTANGDENVTLLT